MLSSYEYSRHAKGLTPGNRPVYNRPLEVPMTRMCFLTVLTIGCGKMDRNGFISDYAAAYCDWEDSCGKIANYGTYDSCIDELENRARYVLAPGEDGCSFDAGEAESCVDAFDGLECQVTAAAKIEACYNVSDCYDSEPEESDDPT